MNVRRWINERGQIKYIPSFSSSLRNLLSAFLGPRCLRCATASRAGRLFELCSVLCVRSCNLGPSLRCDSPGPFLKLRDVAYQLTVLNEEVILERLRVCGVFCQIRSR